MAKLTENIFATLKRVFSNDVVVRRIGPKKFKVIDTYNTQAMGMLSTNYLSQRYSNLFTYNSYGFNQTVSIQAQRLLLFREYEMMDQDPILASALDLYAEEATIKNEYGDILTIISDDQEIKSILENLYYDILNIDFNLLHWTRNLVKYGDMFLKLDLAEKIGIVRVMPISPYFIERQEGFNEDNPYDVRFKVEGPLLRGIFENYEISHFRLLSDSNFLPYGKSMIEQARRTWKQLILMEDAMLIHRIIRAPQKRIFKVDVGNLAPNEVEAYMRKISEQIKKVPYMDEQTGDYNLRYNIQNITEDFFLPTRGGESTTEIDTLPGLEYNAIEDVEYLKHKMMAALRIPKAFLGYEEALGSKATLSQEDIRFARTVERIQKIIAEELNNLAMLHLFLQGYNDEDLANFEIKLSSPSTIYQQEKNEIWKSKLDIAQSAKDQNLLGTDFIYAEMFGFTDTEIKQRKSQVIEDAKFEYRIEQIKTQGNDPQKTGQHADDTGTVRGVDDPDRIDIAGDNTQDDATGEPTGRPKEPTSDYKSDKHVLGRDPLGQRDIQQSNQLEVLKKNKVNIVLKQRIKSVPKKLINTKDEKSNIIKENKEILKGSIKNALDDDQND